jgi:hypothetical protein
MTKAEQQKELEELITRFRRLKKAMVEEDSLSSAHRAAAEIARSLTPPKLTREQVLVKAKELAEQQHAQRLANQLQKSGVLGTRPPPRQPTNEEMQTAAQNMWAQANGFSSQENMNKAEAEWGNGINNWLAEAVKPINSRFKNEEEERAYWDRIKISDSGRGTEGY